MFKIENDQGQFLVFETNKAARPGNVEINVSFDLIWVKGKVASSCSEERILNLSSSLQKLYDSNNDVLNFIDDGSIDLEAKKNSLGKVTLIATLMPDMISDDQIEFSITGVLTVLSNHPRG